LAAKPGFTVATGEHAPMTAMKEEVISESRSDGQQLACDLAAMAREMKDANGEPVKVILTMTEVRNWVARQRNIMNLNDRRLEKVSTLKHAMVAAGLTEPLLKAGEVAKRFTVDVSADAYRQVNIHDYIKTYVVANFTIQAGVEWNAIKEHHKRPEDVWPM